MLDRYSQFIFINDIRSLNPVWVVIVFGWTDRTATQEYSYKQEKQFH
jgi:hypothetical protein